MLTKMVDGKVVNVPEQEECFIKSYWEANRLYPKYNAFIGFDWKTPHFEDIEKAKIHHKKYILAAIDMKLKELQTKLEIAQEEKDFSSVEAILLEKKKVRSFQSLNFDSCTSLQDLMDSIPQELKHYWL